MPKASAPIRLNEQVDQAFDKAAAHTKHDPTLLAQIKACNAVCRFAFPIRRDDGSVRVINAWRAEHSHHACQPRVASASVRMSMRMKSSASHR